MIVAQYCIFPLAWSGLAQAIGIGGWLFVFLSTVFEGNSAGVIIQIVVFVIIIIQLFTIPWEWRFHESTHFKRFILHGIVDWVGIEMLRSFIPPINTHAFISQTMYSQPWFLQGISVFSVYGLSLIIIMTNYAICQAMMNAFMLMGYKTQQKIEKPLVRSGIFVSIVGVSVWINLSLFLFQGSAHMSEKVRVAAVQHNYVVPGHQDTPISKTARFEALTKLTLETKQDDADLIVWPELGLGFDPQALNTDEFITLAQKVRAYIL